MTKEEFFKKYNIHFDNPLSELSFFIALDNLYVQFTREQIHGIVDDFCENADELFNETKDAIETVAKKISLMFSMGELDANDTDEEESDDFIDKSHWC